jgi:hypothetical protein
MLLLLSVITMTDSVTTSGYVSPQASPTFSFFPSLTFKPSFTFTFPTMTSSTNIFTFLPSLTFIFTHTSTSSMSTLPPATSTVLQKTDWAVLGIDAVPLNPQAGDQMFFSMSFAALSSNMPFPQTVYVQCQIDGFGFGAGTVVYGGPVGSLRTVSASSYWAAIPGTHILTWFVDTTHDPDPGNNVLSIQFVVQPPQAPTTEMPSLQTTQAQVTPFSTEPLTTVIQTSIQTVTQSPTQSSSGPMAISLQDYSLPIVIIVLLILVLAFTMRKRKTTTGPQSNSWFCTRCGTANSVNDNFCGKCGLAKGGS